LVVEEEIISTEVMVSRGLINTTQPPNFTAMMMPDPHLSHGLEIQRNLLELQGYEVEGSSPHNPRGKRRVQSKA